jgi:hypothetical protein
MPRNGNGSNHNNSGERTSYPVEIWKPRVADSKGHSSNLGCKVQPGIARAIRKIVQSGVFPYGTDSDFLRHAIVRHLQYLSTLERIPNTAIGMLITTEVFLQEEEAKERFKALLPRFHDTIHSLLNSGTEGSRQKAVQVLSTIMAYIRSIDDEYYRRMFIGKMRNEYGDMINEAELASGNMLSDDPADSGELLSLLEGLIM